VADPNRDDRRLWPTFERIRRWEEPGAPEPSETWGVNVVAAILGVVIARRNQRLRSNALPATSSSALHRRHRFDRTVQEKEFASKQHPGLMSTTLTGPEFIWL